MLITCVRETAEGESYFDEIHVSLRDHGMIGRLSNPIPVSSVIFRETPADYDYDWHRAPQRQLIVLLDGEIEIEVSGGEKRRFRGGDILLVEDVGGRGHHTRTINDMSRRSLFIPLEASSEI